MEKQLIELVSKINKASSIPLVSGSVADYVRKLLSLACIISQHQNGRVSGFIAFYANDSATRVAYLSMLAVDEYWRGHGLGSRLLDYSIRDLTDIGFKAYRLSVLKENEPALELYRKRGFRVISGADRFHHLMELSLQ